MLAKVRLVFFFALPFIAFSGALFPSIIAYIALVLCIIDFVIACCGAKRRNLSEVLLAYAILVALAASAIFVLALIVLGVGSAITGSFTSLWDLLLEVLSHDVFKLVPWMQPCLLMICRFGLYDGWL